MKYDYVIVGAGIFGVTFARQMTDNGAKCLVIDRRDHIGGNCYTEEREGINVHVYGPHILHTDNINVWRFVNKYASCNRYLNRPKVVHLNSIYSFPINLMTLHQLCGVRTPQEAKRWLEEARVPIENPANLEEWMLSQVGERIYTTFIKGYTTKQWGKDPKELPASIIKRLPIRLTYDENYFSDTFQGIPKGGFTQMFEKMLFGIPVELKVDYLQNRNKYDAMAHNVVYTGALDEYFNYDMGKLEWRSLYFDTETLGLEDFQGNAVMNYTDPHVHFTRVTEHKHFEFCKPEQQLTIITREFPQDWNETNERFYPINTNRNKELYNKYRKRIPAKILLGGRLAEYAYYDMDVVIEKALQLSKKCQ
jgi:UDP-galactopyranose mutase